MKRSKWMKLEKIIQKTERNACFERHNLLQKDDICFKHPGFQKSDATLMSSRNATRQGFDQVIDQRRVERLTQLLHDPWGLSLKNRTMNLLNGSCPLVRIEMSKCL